MTQPQNRNANLAAIAELDEERGEIWIQNPWKVGATNENLSAYEPNQIFLNSPNGPFINIGYLTTADSDGDGRGVMVADVTGDLQPDLVLRSSGGGPLRVYANQFPATHRLVVTLEGTASNRLGIGATVTAEVGGQRITRQLFPQNNFVTSQASQVRFGLGAAESVERLTIRWPSGTTQVLHDVRADRHIRVIEGQDEVVELRSAKHQ